MCSIQSKELRPDYPDLAPVWLLLSLEEEQGKTNNWHHHHHCLHHRFHHHHHCPHHHAHDDMTAACLIPLKLPLFGGVYTSNPSHAIPVIILMRIGGRGCEHDSDDRNSQDTVMLLQAKQLNSLGWKRVRCPGVGGHNGKSNFKSSTGSCMTNCQYLDDSQPSSDYHHHATENAGK